MSVANDRSPAQGQDPQKADQAVLEQRVPALLDKWSRGEANLRDIYGYTEDELYGIAGQGYILMMEGKLEPAKAIFEGLVALDPKNDYYYRALGVLYHRLGDGERAMKQFGYAIKVAPNDLISYVNRAEIAVQQKNFTAAEEDLRQVILLGSREPDHPMVQKAGALLKMMPRRR